VRYKTATIQRSETAEGTCRLTYKAVKDITRHLKTYLKTPAHLYCRLNIKHLKTYLKSPADLNIKHLKTSEATCRLEHKTPEDI
jgi:hypothetical protein